MSDTAPRPLPFDERGGLVVLVDPGRTTPADAFRLARRAESEGCCGLLVGDSQGCGEALAPVVAALRAGGPHLPVVQFPASASELSPDVDAVLFLSLVSGRNPRYLIDEQVRAVPFFERHPLVAAVSTAYVLIDGGSASAVSSVSGTAPLPADDATLVAAHVKAAKLLGMYATYLEAGSGARRPVAACVIERARAAGDGPLFVGGGITSAAAARVARLAGADYVVVGNLFEREPARSVGELASAARR